MSTREATLALRRFGLGARPGEIKTIASDPRGYLLSQLKRASDIALNDPDLDPSHVTYAAARATQQQQRIAAQLKAGEGAIDAAQAAVEASAKTKNIEQRMAAAERPMNDIEKQSRVQPALKAGRIRREAFLDEATVRFRHQAATDAPLPERLVMFWSNHFCAAARGPVRAIAGAYEREAIRPHVLGRFADMLKAVEQHPGMLIFLDNQLSFGPNSQAGRNQKKGLNENLAREILELHTLGVDGGYKQEDVTNLARIITGWTVADLNNPTVAPGRFFYHPQRHEPGNWSVLGKTYPDHGHATGLAVLDELARHPATARHIARKLARHFISNEPPKALVEKLETTFRKTDGDLGAVTKALVTSDEAWTAPARKIVPPVDLVVTISRSLSFTTNAGEMLRLATQLGQPLWQAPSPKGWPDDDEGWANPSAIRERLRLAEQVARTLTKTADPRELAEDVLGPDMAPETRQAIARAETREQGLELLIMSPEFQRR
jgi:uncharacterized protein (DUF1800 family)